MTEQGCTISHNRIDIRPTNVNFTLQNVKVRANFPASTKESVSNELLHVIIVLSIFMLLMYLLLVLVFL